MMEMGKRKRRPGDVLDDEQRRPRALGRQEEERAVSEAEVEEFFAILRRMHDANRSLTSRTGEGGPRHRDEKVGARWWPAFSWEDFRESNAVGDGVHNDPNPVVELAAEERVAENGTARGLDLNAEPEPEPAR